MIIKSKCPYCGCEHQNLLLGYEQINAVFDQGIIIRCSEESGCGNRYAVFADINVNTCRIEEDEDA